VFKKELLRKGFKTMNEEGIRLVDEGVTSIPEFIRTMYDAR